MILKQEVQWVRWRTQGVYFLREIFREKASVFYAENVDEWIKLLARRGEIY